MLKISIIELTLIGIPESLLFFLAVYTFSKTKFNLVKYIISSSVFCIMVYLIRLLPIEHGADVILNLIVIILLSNFINKIDIIQSIKAGLIIMLLQFLYEGINVFVLQYVFNADINKIFKNPTLKVLYIIPSLLAFGITVISFSLKLRKKTKLKEI